MQPPSRGISHCLDQDLQIAEGEQIIEHPRTFRVGHSSQQSMRTVLSGRHAPGIEAANGGVQNDVFVLKPSKEENRTLVISGKKHLPIYPPGSQEEQWQLQITARGRVNCPKCNSVSRKTVEGLKKHMDNCSLQVFTCQHCGKQLKSSPGMKYHIMADHSNPPTTDHIQTSDKRAIKDKLRKILRLLGKVKCSNAGCTAAFSSIMGYIYHMKKCGKEQAELDKMLLSCSHCGKIYKSKSGLNYHLKSEHLPVGLPQLDGAAEEVIRVRRASAVLAKRHMTQLANKLCEDWPKRTFQSDLVPDEKKLKYTRPSLPAFSQELLTKWRNEVKLHRKIYCPNQGCGCEYTTVSGLKTHLGHCTMSDYEVGKYRCLLCAKEFHSERGVKYHINAAHSEDWFMTNKKASVKFLKNKPRETIYHAEQKNMEHYDHPHQQTQHLNTPLCTQVERSPGPEWQAPIEIEDADKMAEGNRREHEERQAYDFEQS